MKIYLMLKVKTFFLITDCSFNTQIVIVINNEDFYYSLLFILTSFIFLSIKSKFWDEK